MPILRLAYVTQFMIAVIAVFVLWAQVGGQSHLDLMPWHVKFGLGCGVALAAVRATKNAVEGGSAWNGGTLKWFGIMLALAAGCGLASYYFHIYGESEDEQQEETLTSWGRLQPARDFNPGACPTAERL
jgi:hypothetical protein